MLCRTFDNLVLGILFSHHYICVLLVKSRMFHMKNHNFKWFVTPQLPQYLTSSSIRFLGIYMFILTTI